MGIDCFFRYAPPDKADNVSLYIGLTHLNSDPHLSDLCVCWGAGSDENCIKLELVEDSVPWSADSINRIENALPMLYKVLTEALRNPPFPNTPTVSPGGE